MDEVLDRTGLVPYLDKPRYGKFCSKECILSTSNQYLINYHFFERELTEFIISQLLSLLTNVRYSFLIILSF